MTPVAPLEAATIAQGITLPNVAISQLAAWGTLVLLLSALLFGVALLLERLARGTVTARAIWGGAFAVMVGLALTAPLRPAPSPDALQLRALVPVLVLMDSAATRADRAAVGSYLLLERARTLLGAPITAASRAVARTASATSSAAAGSNAGSNAGAASTNARLARVLLVAWGVASLSVLGLLLAGYRRLMRRLHGAEGRTVAGVPVVVTDDIGPVVAGVRTPRIVLPRWLLERPAHEQALVVAHEQAHVAARDPQLLLLGALGVVLLPWNPFSWWFLARLRLAIEVDCDRRVLSRGASPSQYGRLLIDLSAAAPRLPLAAPAFSHHTTHLERRLRTMTTRAPRHPMARRLALAATSALALLTACESQLPTAADVERMDAKAVETRVAGLLPADSAVTRFIVDGRPVSEQEVRAVPAERIATIEVRRGAGTTREMVLRTRTGVPATADFTATATGTTSRLVLDGGSTVVIEGGDTVRAVRGTLLARGASSEVVVVLDTMGRDSAGTAVRLLGEMGTRPRTTVTGAPLSSADARPLMFIDGVRVESTALQRLDPDRIATIEVIKGDAARARYGPEGANGVITISLKRPER